jgi:hypothetical protein
MDGGLESVDMKYEIVFCQPKYFCRYPEQLPGCDRKNEYEKLIHRIELVKNDKGGKS